VSFVPSSNSVVSFDVGAVNNDRSLVSDGIVWKLNTSGRFTTKSLYLLLENDVFGSNNKWIWDANLPLKIKFFL
jgi:hypothetical protein